MKRRLFNIAASLSLLLFLATIALWVRSYWVSDYLTHGSIAQSARLYSFRSLRGAMQADVTVLNAVQPARAPTTRRVVARPRASTLPVTRPMFMPRPARAVATWHHLPLEWQYIAESANNPFVRPPQFRTRLCVGRQVGRFISNPVPSSSGGPSLRRSGPVYLFAIPLYPIAAATALLPLLWLAIAMRRRRRRRRGLCIACGYDLTANTSGACPECGRPTTGVKA